MIDRRRKFPALAALLAASLFACSGDDIVFPGDDDDDDVATITVKGNIDDVSPVTTRDIVVFVYNVDDAGDCPCPGFPADTSQGKAAVVESGETDFTLSELENGAIKVVFLLDNPGDDADGTIDAGDPIAVLDDEDCEIDDLDGEITVTLADVDINFAAGVPADCQNGNPPAAGRARADQITQVRTTTGN